MSVQRRLAIVCLLCALAPSVQAEPATPPPNTESAPRFAVVELFTSEGCSSCPPADDLLSDLVTEASILNAPIYPLAFHVDYWDQLGWLDAYSHPVYTLRQRSYAKALRLNRLYTPQMIVNGTEAFVGSDEARMHTAIAAALDRPAAATLTLQAVSRAARLTDIIVTFEVQGATGEAAVQLAVVERRLISHVLQGENAGRTLAHNNVVRAFSTVYPGESRRGRIELRAPTTLDRAEAEVIGYVQDLKTMAILGASRAQISLPPPRRGKR